MPYDELRGKVAIVGADEADENGAQPDKSVLRLHAESATNAIRDAGLTKDDIDGLFTAGTNAATLAEYLGLRPRYVDGTSVGGCSFVIMIEHAMLALSHGMCNYALISHGESGRSRVGHPPGSTRPCLASRTVRGSLRSLRSADLILLTYPAIHEGDRHDPGESRRGRRRHTEMGHAEPQGNHARAPDYRRSPKR